MEENKYQRGKIYKIVDNGYNMVYYGSTIKLLCQRMGCHRMSLKNGTNKCAVKQIFETYGVENCKIELVENYPCNNRDELNKREGYYIQNNQCINKLIAGRTRKQHYDDNKESLKDYSKQYRKANKETIKEYNKKYYEANKKTI